MSRAPLPHTTGLPAATRMGAVTLAVSRLAQSGAFYTQIIGLTALARGHTPAGEEMLTLGTGTEPLLHLVEQPGATPPPDYSTGLFHVALRLPARADLGRVLLHLARHRVPVGFGDHAVSEALYLNDPDGSGLELYYDRPREDWQWHGTQVVMGTGPVDVDGLVAAVPNPAAPFGGLPAGTVVGHVHLRVGDLARAGAFYTDLVGFAAVATLPGALFVSAGGYHHHLGLNTWQSQHAPPPPATAAGLRDYSIHLPDSAAQQAVVTRLAAAAIPHEQYGGVVTVADPWGHRLRLVVD
ncbi:MAG: VOC family protein [Anaerolineae bacterium]|nr:VOC family protein [Anaerolineae bacterium]